MSLHRKCRVITDFKIFVCKEFLLKIGKRTQCGGFHRELNSLNQRDRLTKHRLTLV